MPVENATTISELNPAFPTGGDSIGEGDNHIRMIKQVLQNTFPGGEPVASVEFVEDPLDGNNPAALRNLSFAAKTFILSLEYKSGGGKGCAIYHVVDVLDYVGTPDDIVDIVLANGNVAVNTASRLLGSQAGMLDDNADYTTELQALADQLNPGRSLHIDSTAYSLSDVILINKGFQEITHDTSCKVTWLGAGLDSTTSKAIFSINLDSNGLRTNETILTTTTAEVLEGVAEFALASVANLAIGDVIRIDKHICRIAAIEALVVRTDRTLPIPSMPLGSEVSRLDMPNIGSHFQGPQVIQFAPDVATQVYGFGVIATLCYGVKVSNIRGLHNASRLAELFYCADSELRDVMQYEPSDNAGGGQSYAARISNGNDNWVHHTNSFKGRHCVDITFSHRNLVEDCKDFEGEFASYLTHFNGCRHNRFVRCDLYSCKFGVYLGGDSGLISGKDPNDGDFNNEWTDSLCYNSRGIYRPVEWNYFKRIRFINDVVASFRDVFVPRDNGESILNLEDCVVDIVNVFSNVDSDFTVNMIGGSYKCTVQDGLFRGISSGTPGSPTTTAAANFTFRNVNVDIPVGQGRNNINADVLFEYCHIEYDEQPFGEDMGNQKYRHCSITNRNASDRYLITVGSGNDCELYKCELFGTDLPFRYFATFPATGTITFGDNVIEKGYAASILANMNWETKGYVCMPLLRTDDGSPIDGSIVYIDSDVTTDPFKRKRVSAAWVGWTV